MSERVVYARDLPVFAAEVPSKYQEAVCSYIRRIRRSEREIAAWEYLELSRFEQLLDGPDSAGHLAGVPFAVKDVIHVEGMPTLGGAPELLSPDPQRHDAELVRVWRAGGAAPVGKTVTGRYGMMFAGKTRNPFNLAHTPGASSSGSAAAVAAGMVPLSVGTQTGGSMIRPAAYCGVTGFKPSYGQLPTAGVLPLSPTLDTTGIFARDVRDIIFAVYAEVVPQMDLTRESRIGLYLDGKAASVTGVARQTLDRVTREISKTANAIGMTILDGLYQEALNASLVIAAVETRRRFQRELAEVPRRVSQDLVDYCEREIARDVENYRRALSKVAPLRRRVDEMFTDIDILIMPSTRTVAPPFTDTGTSEFISGWTLLGNPSLNLPLSPARGVLPGAVQLIGARGSDREFLKNCVRVEDHLRRSGMLFL